MNHPYKLRLTSDAVNRFARRDAEMLSARDFGSVIVEQQNRKGETMADAPNQQVQIKADEKELLGQYTNLAVVHHNAEEFTLNFIYVFPTLPQGKLVASLILSPTHAKRLSRALQ